jgi:hypothetical protein
MSARLVITVGEGVSATELIKNVEALTGQITALVTILRAANRIEDEGGPQGPFKPDWVGLSLFADHLEDLTNDTIWEYLWPALVDAAELEATREGATLAAGGAR